MQRPLTRMPPPRFAVKLALVSVLMLLPVWILLAWNWPVNSDPLFYAAVLKTFSAQFWRGDLYPRWLMDANLGFGSPVSLFYSPLAFYAGSLLEWLAPVDPHAFGRIQITMSVALFIAGITVYRWLRRHLDEASAQRGAFLYATFPYLVLIIYPLFGPAKLAAFAVFPFMFEAADDLLMSGFRAVPKLTIGYALLCLAHLPSTIVFGPIPFLYVVAYAPLGRRAEYLIWGGVAVILAIGLTAIYWLPALSNEPYILSDQFINPKVPPPLTLCAEYVVRFGLIVAPLLLLFSELPKHRRKDLTSGVVPFHIAIIAILAIMSLPLSAPLLHSLPVLRYLQFPARFFPAMIPSSVFIAARWLPHAKTTIIFKALTILAVLSIGLVSAGLTFHDSSAPVAAVLEDDLIVAPEYRTSWQEEAGLNDSMRLPDQYRSFPQAMFVTGKGHAAAIIYQSSRKIHLHVDVQSPTAEVVVRRFYFPGWQSDDAVIGQRAALLAVQLNRGIHDVTLRLPWFAGEVVGSSLSACALAILVVWAGFVRLRAKGGIPTCIMHRL